MLFIVLKCTSLNLGRIGYLRNFVLIEVISYLSMHNLLPHSVKGRIASGPGVSFIKLCVGSLLKVYVRPKAKNGVRQKIFRFIKPCVRQNQGRIPFINPSQRKHMRLLPEITICLQRLVLLCTSSSAYHLHVIIHPRDTMLTYKTLFLFFIFFDNMDFYE